jgi:hypothetical protein
MAISKNRPSHKAKVAERHQELIAMRLEAGMTRNGSFPRQKGEAKRQPLRNPNRINMTKSQKRVAKTMRRLAREVAAL